MNMILLIFKLRQCLHSLIENWTYILHTYLCVWYRFICGSTTLLINRYSYKFIHYNLLLRNYLKDLQYVNFINYLKNIILISVTFLKKLFQIAVLIFVFAVFSCTCILKMIDFLLSYQNIGSQYIINIVLNRTKKICVILIIVWMFCLTT